MKRTLLFMLIGVCICCNMLAQPVGHWSLTARGLPQYHYTGKLPFVAYEPNGKDANLPEDPYFLLGNYRMALITHASGRYQLLTAERVWARMNADTLTNYGWNEAGIIHNGKTTTLTGMQSVAADTAAVHKTFGVGFAGYKYQLPNSITCQRVISVKPSPAINTGNPAFVITVSLTNTGKKQQQVSYYEKVLANYVVNGLQYTPLQKQPMVYSSKIIVDGDNKTGIAINSATPNKLLILPNASESFPYETKPPAMFMHAVGERAKVTGSGDTLAATYTVILQPKQTQTLQFVIGIANEATAGAIQQQVDELLKGMGATTAEDGLFASDWKQKLPDLSAENNPVLKREMLWNAHMTEALAKYSDYYKETFIPQGTVYSFYYGDNISNRDHLQAALAACYTNPALAKSCLRYVMKHAPPDGEIKRGNQGYGYSPPSIYKESDEQLFFFNTLAEYLNITKDFAFLNEQVEYYPAEYGRKEAVITFVERFFIYLRDEIGLGKHGFVKMLNSDWSDSFFHTYSPNIFAGSAESLLNSAMVLSIFPKVTQALTASGNAQASELLQAMELYRKKVDSAFMAHMEGRKFSARAYLNDKLKFGIDNVCIEPQGYLLQIPTLSAERKKEIYDYVKSKVIAPEKIGIRTREKPLWGGTADGEDGGIWFSLEYPVLLGVATFDKAEAWRLMEKFSFQNFTDNYPNYWVGQWTAADEVNSTLYREGLYMFWVPSQDRKHAFQGFCNHPHTWPLFCYFKLKQMD